MHADAELYLGLISGTSADGIDAALLQFGDTTHIRASRTFSYPVQLREQVLALTGADAAISLDDLGQLDVALGERFAHAAIDLLADAQISPMQVRAIGSHGQTIRHRPNGALPFTLQLGDASVIAERTGIVTVADFRRADVASGGQGAPLTPAFHAAVLARNDATRVVLNLGGIANVSILAPGKPVLGFDTGPANCLLDAWAARHLNQPRDEAGQWARSGKPDQELLERLLDDAYFALPPPKSSGREYFNLDWLAKFGVERMDPADVQATLLALSVHSIAAAIAECADDAMDVVACGGGVHNVALMEALAHRMAPMNLRSSSELGIDADFVEATAFAWLARERLAGRPGNLPSVTGASGPRLLGAVYAGRASPD